MLYRFQSRATPPFVMLEVNARQAHGVCPSVEAFETMPRVIVNVGSPSGKPAA